MKQISTRSLAGLMSILLSCSGCGGHAPEPGLTEPNLDKITVGMSKADVEKILGPPTTMQTRQTLKFEGDQSRWEPELLYRYEKEKKSATITLKDDKVTAKESDLGKQP